MPIIDTIRGAMRGGGNLDLQIDPELNTRYPGMQGVYLHQPDPSKVIIDLDPQGGEPAQILWLPWKQGEFCELQPLSIERAPVDTVFLTHTLTGCKVFAIRGGPVWHIDALVSVAEFWPRIAEDEWVVENWAPGTARDVAYIVRSGQPAGLWDLSAHITGPAPTTYGAGNVGMALVGGIVNRTGELVLYYKASPWAKLAGAPQSLKKR